jgi:hypothetical protein
MGQRSGMTPEPDRRSARTTRSRESPSASDMKPQARFLQLQLRRDRRSQGVCARRGCCELSPALRPREIGGHGAGFRANGVALELYRVPRQPDVIAQSVRLPFSLADFHSVGRSLNPSTEQRELFFRVDGANYWATAWVGKHSSRPDRLALASLISAIRTR